MACLTSRGWRGFGTCHLAHDISHHIHSQELLLLSLPLVLLATGILNDLPCIKARGGRVLC